MTYEVLVHNSVRLIMYVQHLKARLPRPRHLSGQRCIISVFRVASKIICDDTHSNKSWCIVGKGMFTL